MIFQVTSAKATLTMNGNLAISGITSADKNAYGILIDSTTDQEVAFSATTFKTISITGVTASGKDKEAYVFKNAGTGTATFNKVGLVAGSLPASDAPSNFGIYAGLANAKFDFGSAGTTFASAEQGIIVANDASFENDLTFTAITGATGAKGANGTNSNDNGATGTAGGNAYGITATADGKTLNLDGNITFTSIAGGAGGSGGDGNGTGDTNGGNGGAGGDAYGIYLSGSNGLTIAGNGTLTFTSVTGGNGGAGGTKGNSGTDGQNGADGNAYIINNAGTGTLTLGNTATTVSIGAGVLTNAAGKGTYGIYNNLDANYAFGNTVAYITSADKGQTSGNSGNGATNAGANADAATGLILQNNATFSGNLTQHITAGNGGQGANGTGGNSGNGGVGGSAYGIGVKGGTTLTLNNSTLKFYLKAGKGGLAGTAGSRGVRSAGIAGNSGDAYGIYRNETAATAATFKGKGMIHIADIAGGAPAVSGGTAGDAYILVNAAANSTDKAATITFGADNFATSQVTLATGDISGMTAGTTYGIYNNLATDKTAKYDFGSLQTSNAGDSVGTKFYIAGNQGTDATASRTAVAATDGGDVVGIYAGGISELEGKLELQAKAGDGGSVANATEANVSGKNGGNATALYTANGATLSLENDSVITLSATAGNGSNLKGTGNATTVVNGVQGDAYGIKAAGDFTLDIPTASGSKTVGSLKLSVSGNNAYGIYLAGAGKKTDGSATVNAANEVDLGALTLDNGATSIAVNGASKAYGIYNASDAWNKLSGTITLGDGTYAAVGSATATEAYGIYNAGKLEIAGNVVVKTDALKTKTPATDTKSYTLYNKGNLTIGKAGAIKIESTTNNLKALISSNLGASSTLVLGNLVASNLDATESDSYVFAADGANTVLNLKATDKAINNDNGGYVLNLAGKKTVFNQASDGQINLDLGSFDTATGAKVDKAVGTKVIFGSDAGEINTLSGSNADILLAGADQTAVNARFESTNFARRTLVVNDMQLSGSHFVLAAQSDTTDTNPNIIKSDTIAATTTSSGADKVFKNTLHVVVDKYVTEVSDKVAVLAVVDSSKASNIVFNDLTADGKAKATAYGNFTNGDIEIVRETQGSHTFYTSDLRTTNISVNTEFVAPATAALSTGVSLFSANLNSLSKRMGELRNDPYANGVWARVFGGEQTTNFGAKQSTVYSTVQAGYDYKLALENASNYIGVAFSYTKGSGGQVDPAYKQIETPIQFYVPGLSSSNTDGIEVAVYNSYVANSGLYSDSIVKFGYYMSDLTMFGQSDPYSINNLALAVSEEVGYKFKLGSQNEWFITPQGEIAFAYMGGSEFTQSNGSDTLKSTQDATSLLRARVGAAWGYDFSHLAKESDVKASVYLGTYYTYDYFIGGDTTLTATEKGITSEYKHNAYEGTGRFVMNLGTNIDVKDSTKVYFDFEKSFGGNIQTDYQVSLGVRFGFGEKISAPKQEEKKPSEPALKPKELENPAE